MGFLLHLQEVAKEDMVFETGGGRGEKERKREKERGGRREGGRGERKRK